MQFVPTAPISRSDGSKNQSFAAKLREDLSGLRPSGTEAARSAGAWREFGGFDMLCALAGRNDELSDLHATADAEWPFTEVDQHGFHFAAIIAVDSAGRIEHGDTMLKCQSRSRPHLCLVSFRQSNGDTAGDRRACATRKFDISGNRRDEIQA